MLHLKNSLIAFVILLLVFTSCKKEFTDVGNQLVDLPHYEGKLYTESKVKVYDQRVEKVYAKNFPLNAIGVYNDPVFGRLEADFVSGLKFTGFGASQDPDGTLLAEGFGDNVKIIDAKLIIPYYTHVETDQSGNKYYEADSIYGQNAFRIKIYENSYLLSGLNANDNLHDQRHFYSDFDFNAFKTTLLADSIHFTPNMNAYITYKREKDGTFELDDNNEKIVKDSLSPRFVMPLDTTFFRQKIFDHSGEQLILNTILFKDYFRGIHIDAIAENNDGQFILLNTLKGKIEVSYTYEFNNEHGTPDDTSDDTIDTVYKKIYFMLETPSVNTYTNQLNVDYQTAINNSDEINGDDKLYLKGDAGSQAIVSLFDNQQLRELRDKDWMINQAEIIFYVDDDALINTLSKPDRLLLYDYDNKKYLSDLYAPENTSSNNEYFDGKLQEDEDGNHYYSFVITRHVRNIIKNNKTNVRLGLRVTPTIDTKSSLLKGETFIDPDRFNPSGTILYGNQTTVVDKKPILKIYYTDPK